MNSTLRVLFVFSLAVMPIRLGQAEAQDYLSPTCHPDPQGIAVGCPPVEAGSQGQRQDEQSEPAQPAPTVPAVQNQDQAPGARDSAQDAKRREEQRAEEGLIAQQSQAASA